MGWTTRDPAMIQPLIRCESEISEVFAACQITGVCQYYRGLFGSAQLAAISAAHAHQAPAARDRSAAH